MLRIKTQRKRLSFTKSTQVGPCGFRVVRKFAIKMNKSAGPS